MRHMMQVDGTLWEALVIKAAEESLKQKKTITPAKYVKMIMLRHLKRVAN